MIKRLKDLSIRQKLTRVTMLAAFAALVSASVAFAVYDMVTFRAALVRKLSTTAGIVGYNAVSTLVFSDPPAATQTLAALKAEPHVGSAAIYTREGKLFAIYRRTGVEGPDVVPHVPGPPAASHRFEDKHLFLFEPILFEGKPIGTVFIQSDLTEIDQRIRRYLGIIVLVGAASLLVALVISARLQRLIAEPLLRLAGTAQVVSKERDYSVRAEPAGSDEIGLLIETFNEMLAQIQRRDAEVRTVAADNERLYREAHEANRMKDEFLATLSHELRTPLNAIVGWTKLLQEGNMDGPMARRAVTTIDRNARAQTRLIEDILDVSRIVSGKLRLNVRPLSLQGVVEAALDSVRPGAAAKEIEIVSRLDPTADALIGDPDRLQQVVWNLLSNAIKFTPRRGRVEVRSQRAGSNLELSIEDTGMGIPKSFLPHVFERFRQADASSTRTHGGLGLGLAIVRHVVELHGGSVSVRSEGEGKGSVFTLSLPARSRAEERGQARTEPAAAAGADLEPKRRSSDAVRGLRVLVVEDEPDSRELLVAMLESFGASPSAVQSGPEALERFQQERPDVVLSDIGMPGMDGYALLRRIRALPVERGGATPAAAITAYARAEDREAVLKAGFQVFLSKPVQPGELLQAMETMAGTVRSG